MRMEICVIKSIICGIYMYLDHFYVVLDENRNMYRYML